MTSVCRLRREIVCACLGLLVAATTTPGCAPDPYPLGYEATIRWTSFGVPHVTADDLPSATFGQAWAFTSHNGCILADQITKVRSERALFFGPGEDDEHIDSDFHHLAMNFYETGARLFEEQPEDIQAVIHGFAAGYNTYLEQHGDEMPCAGEPWVQPITAVDLMAHYVELGTLASARAVQAYVVTATPPSAGLAREPEGSLADLRERRPGSNGWAIGRDRTAHGGGLLVGNPHFPWEGELRLFESHLTVPGEFDVYGASLMGVVGILIGFNDAVAWTHTVSAGNRFTFYKLDLDPSDPTRYLYDGAYRDMDARTFSIDVRRDDGSIGQVTRTAWSSHYGPILNVPPFGWSPDFVFTMRDANAENGAMLEQFLRMNQSRSLEEFQKAHGEVQGIPWVNTIAASADGRAWYADTSATPNLSDAAIAAWLDAKETDFLTSALAENGVVLLDGGNPLFEWVEESGARSPGLVPFGRMPKLQRTDFVFNANDSYWSSNPLSPVTGVSPLHGPARAPLSPRTRMNATLLTETGEGTASGSDGKFDFDELRDAILSNRGMMAELLRDDVVERCQGADPVVLDGQTIDVAPACDALAAWDLRLDLDSHGAVLWRELLGTFEWGSFIGKGPLFATDFDPDDPIATPAGLPAAGADSDRILEALAAATVSLGRAGLPLTASLREAQFTRKADETVAMHGGISREGVPNLIQYSVLKSTVDPPMARGPRLNDLTGLTEEGYVVNYGTSFLLAVELDADGPEASAFVTYGQSHDPRSPHFIDQTRRFSDKQWRRILYREDDIEADPELFTHSVWGARESR
jgi:acyl-homoserine-lactone acylase